MTDIVESDVFPEKVTLIDQGERVRGGTGGVDNRAPSQLASRTRWLKNRVDELKERQDAGTGAIEEAVREGIEEIDNHVKTVRRQFMVAIFDPSVTNNKLVYRLTAQINLKSQALAIDWVGLSDSTGPCVLEFRIKNDGVSMSVPAKATYANGKATFEVTPHNLFNGDTLEIRCISGSATNLSLTAVYDIGAS